MRIVLLCSLFLSSACLLKGTHTEIVDDYQQRIAGLQGELEDRDALLAEQTRPARRASPPSPPTDSGFQRPLGAIRRGGRAAVGLVRAPTGGCPSA